MAKEVKSKLQGAVKMFKKKRGIRLSYNKQGLIYFTCLDIKNQPKEIQDKILNLCIKIGGIHYKALYTLLTDDTKNVHSVAMEHHISETQLYFYRKKFYENW